MDGKWVSGLIVLVFCLTSIKSNAQQINNLASNVKFSVKADAMIISYNLPESKSDEFFNIEVKIIDSVSHRIVIPKNYSGDLGPAIKGGSGKKIEWNFSKDSVHLSHRYNVIISAESKILRGGPANALKSVILPGWGDYYVYGKKWNPAFLIAVVSYGCVGYGIYNMIQSGKSYQAYHNAKVQTDLDHFYTQAVDQQNTGSMFITIGAAVWAADVVNVLIKGAINAHGKKPSNASANLDWNIRLTHNESGLCLTYKF